MHTAAIKPWYRQFWPWFIISLPASAVLAGLFTLFLAIRYQDPMVVGDYYKEGLGINQEMGKQQRASTLGIQALVRYTARDQQLRLQPLTAGTMGGELVLRLTHPTLAGHDLQLHLQPTEDGSYSVSLQNPRQGNWHISLEPISAEWRLTGRISLTQDSQLLLSAIAHNKGNTAREGGTTHE